MNKLPLVIAVSSALVFTASFAQANGLVAKQLAGPASEFSSMQLQDPSASAIQSKAALLPISFTQDKSGQPTWSGKLPVENGRSRVLVFAPEGEDWGLSLTSPNGGSEKAAASMAREVRDAQFGMEKASHAARYYSFDALTAGDWQIKLRADKPSRGGFLLIEGDARTELSSYQTHRKQWVGERQQIASLLTFTEDEGVPKLGRDAGTVESAMLRVTSPDGAISQYRMHDDGLHGDGLANDGVYGGDFAAEKAGQYLAQVIVEGRDALGQSIIRTAEHVVPVVEPSLRLAATKSAAVSAQPGRLAINLPVSSDKAGGHYRAYAEVWGVNKRGNDVPVAWVGGMVEVENGQLSLGFDERWVAGSKAVAQFELRNLRIEDPDHFVTLASAKRMPLSLPAIKSRPLAVEQPDELMLMGPRPQQNLLAMEKGVGKRLLLVHGYCSGGVWPTANFTTASTFLDANQNRSHDQFARLIQSFGNTWNSFGVVAHSQGGAASLHLYTYYWSGLDNATGSRLIQSVGTPYRGTNLSGILASLGSWFGVGCGTNDNLTYIGASSWLAGIPTWARGKVNYYTTSFRYTNWWSNDYCNFATDLVLSDPEDGTTEQVYGQLPNAVNRGHTTGQCHTAGMRDPAQYRDATRNATMNSNAAR